MKRRKEPKPSTRDAPRQHLEDESEIVDDGGKFDWWLDEKRAPLRSWDDRSALAYLSEESIPPSYSDAVRNGTQWIGMPTETASDMARSPANSRICSTLSRFVTRVGDGDPLRFVASAMDALVETEPTFARCNDLGPLDDGWAFAVALWPGGRAYLLIACGPGRSFGWFTIPATP
jgi:hypothetical protein